MEEETTPVGNSSSSGDGQSSGEGSQQSVDLTTILKKVEGLEKQFAGIQKGADKVNARVEERVNAILSKTQIGRVAELSQAGKTPEEIENQLLLEDLLAERKSKAPGGSVGNTPADSGHEAPNIFTETVKALDMDANDKDVAAAVAGKDFAALIRLAVSKSSVPAPDASTNPPLSSKEKPPGKAEEIERGYLAEIQKVPRGNVLMAANIKAKWRAKAREAGFILNV